MFAKMFGETPLEKYLMIGIGFLVFMFLWITYLNTVQPTVSFWDCGEFISCSYILGVPHPPGAPLFLLIGRLVSFLPIPGWEIAHKINALSSTCGALTLVFFYLSAVYLIRKWFRDKKDWSSEFIAQVGGVTGALLVGFSDTYWFNTVEAEVYAIAMGITTACSWLALVWAADENYKKPRGNIILLFMVLLLYLGLGIHLTVMVFIPPLFLFTVIIDERRRFDWTWWLLGLIIFSVSFGFVPFIVIMLSGLIGFGIASLYQAKYRLYVVMILLSLIGFSSYLVPWIRSHQNPRIDENDPGTITAFKNYMDRKQYGDKSLWELMFTRKAAFTNQLGTHPRMGFWGFFRQQFSSAEPTWLHKMGIKSDNMNLNGTIFLLFCFIGVYWLFRQDFGNWSIFFFLALVGSLGLLIYLNFSDGTKGIQLEVRDRDYFFTPGFMYMGWFIGIGLAAVLAMLREIGKQVGPYLAAAFGVLFLLLPINARAANYFDHDRSKSYVPYDYAWNILVTCADNSILFTNGDNDTFPLWFIQEVMGFKKTVQIANLSLLNTNWYIKQLKNEWGVKISYTDDEIDKLSPFQLQGGDVVRVQDLMVYDIIVNNYMLKPIYIAVTVSPDNKVGYSRDVKKFPLDEFLAMEGLVYRFRPQKLAEPEFYKSTFGWVDFAAMKRNVTEVYNYRGLNDATSYKDENTAKLLQNYSYGFVTLANYYLGADSLEAAQKLMEKCVYLLPDDWLGYSTLYEIYAKQGKQDLAVGMVNKILAMSDEQIESARAYVYLWRLLTQYGPPDLAEKVANVAIARFPDDEYVQYFLLRQRQPQQQRQGFPGGMQAQ